MAKEALAEAAAELFAERGPARVTVREVADRAGVNHGLVHYYFGSKEGLVAAALGACVDAVAAELEGAPDPVRLFAPGSASARHGRLLAQILLEGGEPGRLQGDFPAMRALVDAQTARGVAPAVAGERAALVIALVLGWQLYEPFLVAAAGAASAPFPATGAEVVARGVSALLGPGG